MYGRLRIGFLVFDEGRCEPTRRARVDQRLETNLMKILRVLRGPALSLACIGLSLPHAAFGASPVAVPPAAEGQSPVGRTPAVADVALHPGGMLLGQVVDQQGMLVDNTVVRLRQRDRIVAEVQTDDVGGFSVTGLRGGIYQIETARGSGVYRLWSVQTAPPTARQAALIVSGDGIVRGGPASAIMRTLANPWVFAAIVATAIAVPLALDDDGS